MAMDDEDETPSGRNRPRPTDPWSRKVAEAVTNLTLGLAAAEEAAKYRHQELIALHLATSDPNRKRRSITPEHTDKFKLPAGVELQVPRETTKSAIEKAGKYAFYVVLFLLTHLANCLVNHAHWPAGWEAKKSTPVIAAPAEQ